MLTAIQLVSDDNEESDTGPKGVDGDRYLTEDPCDLPACGPDDLLIGAFIRDLVRADVLSQNSSLLIHSSAFKFASVS